MKICKECGASYEACRTPTPKGLFRWRDVACSPECAMSYMNRVMEARTQAAEPEVQNEDRDEQMAVEPAREEIILEESEPETGMNESDCDEEFCCDEANEE